MKGALALSVLCTTLMACGPAASVTDLRCQERCQDVEDPFLLLLEADLDDPDGELDGGKLVVSVDDKEQVALELDGLRDGTNATLLRFSLPLRFRALHDGQTFTVGVRARRGSLATTPSTLKLEVHL